MNQHSLSTVARWLYTKNPFYLLSACFVLFGLQKIYGTGMASPMGAWTLVLALCGYTSLLVLTTLLIIRLGKVWEDARSLVLIVLLLFVALSTSFDGLCNEFPSTAYYVLLFGFILSIVLTEGLIFGLRVRFPFFFRLPYYVILGIFFATPLWVATGINDLPIQVVRWRIFLFPTISGLAALTLLPAIHRGADYVKDNGTPWRWPWFPWTVFGLLAVGVVVRSYGLTLSFYPAFGFRSNFGLYYLIPFVLAVLTILFEISLVHGVRRLRYGALMAVPVVLMLAIPSGSGKAYDRFLASFTETIGAPLWVATLAMTGFYAYCWIRGSRFAEFGLMSSLGVLVILDRFHGVSLPTHPWNWQPLLVAGLIQSFAFVCERKSWRCFTACGLLAAVSTLVVGDASFGVSSFHMFYHIVFVGCLLIGCAFVDDFARLLLYVAALTMILVGVAAPLLRFGGSMPDTTVSLYTGSAMLISVFLWRCRGERFWFVAALSNVLGGGLSSLWWCYEWSARIVGTVGARAVAWGLLSFLIAVLISAAKGGVFKSGYLKTVSRKPNST